MTPRERWLQRYAERVLGNTDRLDRLSHRMHVADVKFDRARVFFHFWNRVSRLDHATLIVVGLLSSANVPLPASEIRQGFNEEYFPGKGWGFRPALDHLVRRGVVVRCRDPKTRRVYLRLAEEEPST